jgi:hypothetical protein
MFDGLLQLVDRDVVVHGTSSRHGSRHSKATRASILKNRRTASARSSRRHRASDHVNGESLTT